MKTMKLMFVLGALLAALAVQAAGAEQNAVTANVPFYFTVGNTLMPAGAYTISPAATGMLWIRSASRRDFTHVLVIPALPGKARDKGALVFHKYGDRYFLREIWQDGLQTGAKIRVSKPERELLQTSIPDRVHVAVAAFK